MTTHLHAALFLKTTLLTHRVFYAEFRGTVMSIVLHFSNKTK